MRANFMFLMEEIEKNIVEEKKKEREIQQKEYMEKMVSDYKNIKK
jgi:hypothetical protein